MSLERIVECAALLGHLYSYSILMLQYPYKDEELELEMAFVLDIVKTVRSLRSDYGLTAKNKADRKLLVSLDSS